MFPAEPVPDRIGAYKVIRRLSRTGSADVYLGLMEGPMGFRRVCELKLVENTLEGDADLGEELAREAAICSRLNHPAILRIFDFFELDRRLVLVLEHVDGADLERLVQHLQRRKQKLGDDAIWFIASQLLGALSHAHAATDEDGNLTPVVHRNLAPDNVLIGWDGQVRLAGFGLGKILGRSPDTVVGVIKGRPGYMSPEQARGERVTPRADVYGIGLLMWSLLSGRVPPLNGVRPEPLSSIRPDVPRELAAAIEASLEPSPDKRKITCAEIEHWLKKITKAEAGRADLLEKIVLLRSTRTPLGEGAVEPPHTARPPAKVTGQRRRLAIRGLHAHQPGSAFARSSPSSRPPGRGQSTMPPPPGASEPPPSMRRYPTDSPPSERPPASYAPPGGSMRRPSGARRLFDDDGPASFAPPVAAPDSVAPRGLASQPPPPLAFGSVSPAVPPPPSWILPAPPADVAAAQAGLGALLPPPDVAHKNGASTTPAAAAAPPSTGPPSEAPSIGSIEPRPQMFRPPLITRDEDRMTLPGIRSGKPRASRLSEVLALGVAALTAAAVVGAGVFFAERKNGGSNGQQPQQPQVVIVPFANAAPTSAATASPATAAPGGAPNPSSSARANDPMLLPGGYGYLTVKSPVTAVVFVNGHNIGATNEPLQAQCGKRFIRIGTLSEAGPMWVAPGQTVIVPCQSAITIEQRPAPSMGR
ncbi:MAG TPA: protein kinase [Byssovorax sp.]